MTAQGRSYNWIVLLSAVLLTLVYIYTHVIPVQFRLLRDGLYDSAGVTFTLLGLMYVFGTGSLAGELLRRIVLRFRKNMDRDES